MTRDEDTYPEPEEFRPESHLNRAHDDSNPLPSEYVFGFGRRYVACLICLQDGYVVDDRALWQNLSGTGVRGRDAVDRHGGHYRVVRRATAFGRRGR